MNRTKRVRSYANKFSNEDICSPEATRSDSLASSIETTTTLTSEEADLKEDFEIETEEESLKNVKIKDYTLFQWGLLIFLLMNWYAFLACDLYQELRHILFVFLKEICKKFI